MNTETLIIVAGLVFALMAVGLVLTIREFAAGSPKKQEKGKESLQDSPHGDV